MRVILKSIIIAAVIALYAVAFPVYATELRSNEAINAYVGDLGQLEVGLGEVINGLGSTTVDIYYNGTSTVSSLYITYSACPDETYTGCDSLTPLPYANFSLPLSAGINTVEVAPYSSSTPTNRYWRMDINGNVGALMGSDYETPYYVINSLVDDESRIDSFNPSMASTTASTTVYFSVSGYNTGGYDRVRYVTMGDSRNIQQESSMQEWSLPEGYYTVENSDVLYVGNYRSAISMIDDEGVLPLIGETAYFRVTASSTEAFFGTDYDIFATTTINHCSIFYGGDWVDFNLGLCLRDMFVPSGAELEFIWDRLYDDVEDLKPIGFLFPLLEVFTYEYEEQELPDIEIVVPAWLPGGSKTLTLDMWTMVSSTLNAHASGSAVAWLDEKENDIMGVVWLVFAFWLLAQIVSLIDREVHVDIGGEDTESEVEGERVSKNRITGKVSSSAFWQRSYKRGRKPRIRL